MNFRFTVVETSLNRAEFRWKWLKFLQYSFVLGGIVCLLLLILGGVIVAGWLTSKTLGIGLFALIALVGFLAWIAVIISVAAGSPDRNWLASALEKVDRRLLDRLHTLLFLESTDPDCPRRKTLAVRLPCVAATAASLRVYFLVIRHASPVPTFFALGTLNVG